MKHFFNFNPHGEGRKRLIAGQVPSEGFYAAAMPMNGKVYDRLIQMHEERIANDKRLREFGLMR